MPLIMNAPTLADRVLEILPENPDNAMSANELAKFLPGVKTCAISYACRQLRKWHQAAFRDGRQVSRSGFLKACNLWWRV